MNKILVLSLVAFLGACSNYTTDAQHQCTAECADKCMAMQGECTEMKECSGAVCEDMASCCAEAKAAGKECAECAKP